MPSLPSVYALRVRGAAGDLKATLRIDRHGGPRSRAETWEVYLSGRKPEGPFSVEFPSFSEDEDGFVLTCLQLPPNGGMTNESGKAFIYTFLSPSSSSDRSIPELWLHYLPKPLMTGGGMSGGIERLKLGKGRKSEAGEVESLVGGESEDESEGSEREVGRSGREVESESDGRGE